MAVTHLFRSLIPSFFFVSEGRSQARNRSKLTAEQKALRKRQMLLQIEQQARQMDELRAFQMGADHMGVSPRERHQQKRIYQLRQELAYKQMLMSKISPKGRM